MRIRFGLGVALALALSLMAPAAAVVVQSGGIDTLLFTENAGSAADPWLIAENMTSAGTLLFRDVGEDNPTGTGHAWGSWISKTVTNNTGVAWTSFELELQVALGVPSPQGDGLSFADGDPIRFTFSSDLFGNYTRIDLARDYLNFHDGLVNPGESVTFNFAVTDNQANNPWYLLQTPNRVDVPEPATLSLIGAGLVGLAVIRARRRRP